VSEGRQARELGKAVEGREEGCCCWVGEEGRKCGEGEGVGEEGQEGRRGWSVPWGPS